MKTSQYNHKLPNTDRITHDSFRIPKSKPNQHPSLGPSPKESTPSSHHQFRSNHQVVFRQGREVVEVGRDPFNECCVVSSVAN